MNHGYAGTIPLPISLSYAILALNLLGKETSLKRGIKTKRLKAGWDTDYPARILNGWFPNALALYTPPTPPCAGPINRV
jgi:hypothetical protein